MVSQVSPVEVYVLITTLILLVISILIWMMKYQKGGGDTNLPGPAYLFGIGPLVTYAKYLYHGIPEASSMYLNKFGDIVRVWIFGETTIVTSNPQVAYHVLKQNGSNYTSRLGYDTGLEYIGMFNNGIIWNNNTAKWKLLRSFFQNALNAKTLNKAVNVSIKATNNIVSQFDDLRQRTSDGSIETLNVLRRITLQVTNQLMFSVDIADDEHLVALIVDYFKAWEYFLIRPWYLHIPNSTFRKHVESVAKLTEACKQIVAKKKKQMENVIFEEMENPNFLECLVHAVKRSAVTESNVCQCVLEMLLAGTDTSSVSMYYTLVALDDEPMAEQDIMNEVIECFADHQKIDLRKLHSLVNLENALKESMRIKPVGPVVLRKALKDDFINGIRIESGTNIILSLVEMHRRKDLFPNPERFAPNRFRKEEADANFYPFGTGPKGCVGQFLAMIEMKIVVGLLLKRFKFTSVVGKLAEVDTRWDIANQPTNPSYMIIKER